MIKIKAVMSTRYGYPSGYIAKVLLSSKSEVNGKKLYTYKIDPDHFIYKINVADRVGRNTYGTDSISEAAGYFDDLEKAKKYFIKKLFS